MKTSESVNELFAALAKANGEIKNAVKDAENPHFKRDYATLASVLDAVREPLSKNGLSVLQTVRVAEGNHFLLETRLAHASGQWVESETPLLLVKDDMQGLGSAITYARRYALAAMIGVSHADDDDAEDAIDKENREPPKSPVVAPKVGNVARVGNAWGNGPGRV